MSDKKNTPHDALFKKFIETPEVAEEFLENYLPQPFKKKLSCSEVQVEKESFVETQA